MITSTADDATFAVVLRAAFATGENHQWTVRQIVTLDAEGRVADDSDTAEPVTEVQP